ncbi:hypothetical protein PS918_00372 [Pseudomonas fluorescens]|uniref:Peptidase M4 n=1 Tax=Pseudomonas fluorescens TaxID=294 RepID=A0A5E7QWI7_PSEFL|nr:hypothetical protein [Pseudomonas fluorescens]VVP66421.1 hypothetical protein PS918_00372 [Pseudomonas fluorescens]
MNDYPPPAMRKLRVYAFDPQAATQLDTARISHATIQIPWEERWEARMQPGPVNEYFEVIDIDPGSGQFYDPVDLNDRHLLAQDGLTPSEGDPRFHQQMVFAVAMKTVKLFERALGRKVYWCPQWDEKTGSYQQVRKLRIYPHALREANAYYSKEKKALLFGYFKASTSDPGVNLPGSWVFTALSHDIIAHETTHAILDGLHRRYSEATSADSLAFHEAFADIVALMMHFMLPEAVSMHVAANGGNLNQRSWMSGLARQFGEATGRYAALREAIDDKDSQQLPDPTLLSRTHEPHARGAILVAAVFDAFISIYEQRSADLLRLADGTGRAGSRLPPELVQRLTREATKSADHVLRMCIRALDYLPPVDVRFGEFLRGIVTADADLIPDDPLQYRLAMIQAFRRRGILPENCLSLAPDSLLWEAPQVALAVTELLHASKAQDALDITPQYQRHKGFRQAERNRKAVWHWMMKVCNPGTGWERALGVVFNGERTQDYIAGSLFFGRDLSRPAVEVHSVRTCRRAGPDGQDLRQLVIEVTQKRQGFLDPQRQAIQDRQDLVSTTEPLTGDFQFRGGATLIIDLRDGKVRYVICKRIDDDVRLQCQRHFLESGSGSLALTYRRANARDNPFAMTHRGV